MRRTGATAVAAAALALAAACTTVKSEEPAAVDTAETTLAPVPGTDPAATVPPAPTEPPPSTAHRSM